MSVHSQPQPGASFAVGCVPEGGHFVVRPFETGDAAALGAYFERLSDRARYDRFLGAIEPPSAEQLEKLTYDCSLNALIVEREDREGHHIIGEARYVFDDDSAEVALSVADDFRRGGVGTALLGHIERRAACAGVLNIFGDTLRTNDKMLALAKRRGFIFTHPPGEWKLVRFQKNLIAPGWMLRPPSDAVATSGRAPTG